MSGVNPEGVEHHLSIPPGVKSVKQIPQKFTPGRQKAISDEVDHPIEAGFIAKVK
ncbi:hypothetical protein BHM03_00013316 [Ensete ventricosum]|nr:hypothetical protein BHM03_00013316 [Ensete ventricosum]